VIKRELDPEGTLEFGLVAEDVEKVNPDLVGRDDEGRVYTVRYEAVNAMLLNEFLKEHKRVEEQQTKIEN
jgi:trimeric autotransporter adhesin